MDLSTAQTILLSGLVLGSLYALMASGLSLIWGTVRMFNFAHGSFVMLGAYFAWYVTDAKGFGWGKWPGVAMACLGPFALGMIAERLLVHPFVKRRDAVMMVVITTLAAATFIDNTALMVWGPRMKRLPSLWPGNISVLGAGISGNEFLILILAPLLLIILGLFLKQTRSGLAIRGVEQNLKFAQLSGINISLVYAATFGLGASLAAIAGILLGAKTFMTPNMGSEPLLRAFVVVILGGLGNLGGTIGAAYIVGLLEAVCIQFIGFYWTPAVTFLVMIVVLVVRPTGIFGEK